jgi:transposase
MWANQGKVDRLPATYTRQQGVRHWLAFYDVGTDRLWGYFCKRKRGTEVLKVLQRMRAMYPAHERIYLILDNFSPHGVKEVRRFVKKNKITLVWTPTNASWLNRIECQFTELKRFVFHNTNYKSHAEVRTATLKFLRYRHSRNKKRKLKLTI